MDWLHLIILSLVQGITEFLPISSSAHLILPSQVLGWPDQGQAFDVAVHVGTLLAVLICFRHEVIATTRGWLAHVFRRQVSAESRLGWAIIIGTLPAGIIGLRQRPSFLACCCGTPTSRADVSPKWTS